MHVELHPRFAGTADGQTAKDLASACVHCGFCLSTCPTYVDRRDERDSPRGRIHLITQLLESGSAGSETRRHLDRCLTCRNCETACPSGMQYGELLEIGRELIEREAPRPVAARLSRRLLRAALGRPRLLAALLVVPRLLRPLLPPRLRRRIPARQRRTDLPTRRHTRVMLLLEGCVQRVATPATNAAARRVLDRLGITLVSAPAAGCCGAVNHHLAAPDDALADLRRNIDAWWPHVEAGAEAIVGSATACSAMLRDYGRLLAGDPAYADKARQVAALARDLGDVLMGEDLEKLAVNTRIGRVAIHPPCSLQHALGQPRQLAAILRRTGFSIADTSGKLLCCGSAGTYSILQPAASRRLRAATLSVLTSDRPDLIATANIGCQLHLQAASDIPVVHWIELLDDC